MFIRRSTSGIVLLLVYVDDIAFSSNDLASINELTRTLRTQFDMKDLGDCKKRSASGKGKGRAYSGNRSECAYAKGSASTDNWIHRVGADK